MAEPFSLAALTDAITSFWNRSATLLWCLAVISFLLFGLLAAGDRWHIGHTSALFASYGTILGLAFPVLVVLAGFKTYSERPKPQLSLVPKERDCFWGQSEQPNGKIYTQFSLKFQITNFSEGGVVLSDVRLRWPVVRHKHILAKLLVVKHPKSNTYGSSFPILPHSLTQGSAEIFVDFASGTIGRPRRVAVDLQDHAGKWHKLVFPHVPSMQAMMPPRK